MNCRPSDDDRLLAEALRVAVCRIEDAAKAGESLTTPYQFRDWVRLFYAGLDLGREHFTVAFLNSRHRILDAEVLFSGGVEGCEVHPSIVARRALAHDTCVAVVLVHNHPSGHPEPSAADHALTVRLKQALGLIDIRVLDHFIVAGADITSFAERGWL